MSKKVEMEFVADVSKMEKSIEKTTAEISNMRKSVVLLINNLRKTTQIIRQLTDYTDDYVSSMRLMNIVFKDNAKQANAFAENMARITGLDEPTLIRQISMFRQLGESINLTNEYSDKLAEGLTTLAAKMAILYNKDFSVMAIALQRAIQGTQETMKAMTGIEATELGQQMVLTSHGIDRQISSLNEAERSIVMYASILEKVTNDQRIYADAVNSVAWQKQMLIAQVKRLGAAIGGVLYPILQKVLPVLNAILMVITEIITIFGKLVGFSVDASASVGDTASSYGTLAKNITAAGNAAKKQLRGFDKLNNISTPSSGGGAGGAGGVQVDPQVLGLLDQMENNMLNIKNKATEIAEKILTWLGFTRDINGEWTKTEGKLTKFDIIVKGILATLLLITALGIAKKVVNIFLTFLQLKEAIGFLGTSLTVVLQIFGGVAVAVLGIYSIVKGIVEMLRGDTFSGLMDIIGGIALVVAGVALAFGGWTVAAVAALVAVAAYITKWVVKNWETVKGFFIRIWDFLVEKFGGTAQWVYNKIIKPIIDFFKPIIEAIVEVRTNIYNHIIDIVTTVGQAIWAVISKIVEIGAKVIEIFIALGKAFYTYVITPILNFLAPIANWINTKIITPLWNGFVWVKDKVVGLFRNIGITISDFLAGSLKAAINAVFSKIEKNINRFIRMLNKAIKIINQIPGVNVTTVREISLPRFQNGGFPEDGLFMANHNELVGRFSNGRTAVANNEQITEGIRQATYQGMMSALATADFGSNVTIEASGDASGLMNFISFKQKQRDRQFSN